MSRGFFPTLIGALALVLFFFPVLRQLASQVLTGYALMGLALPICRIYEKRLSPSLSATLALMSLWGAVLLMVLLIAPVMLRQTQQVLAFLPQRWEGLLSWWQGLPISRQLLPQMDLSPVTQWLAQAGPG